MCPKDYDLLARKADELVSKSEPVFYHIDIIVVQCMVIVYDVDADLVVIYQILENMAKIPTLLGLMPHFS